MKRYRWRVLVTSLRSGFVNHYQRLMSKSEAEEMADFMNCYMSNYRATVEKITAVKTHAPK